jgi:hypothetical protein
LKHLVINLSAISYDVDITYFPSTVCYIGLVRSPSDNSGLAPLKRDGILVTDTVEKTDILNNQFQSAFTNETDTYIPDKGHSPHSKISQINISSAAVSKLL